MSNKKISDILNLALQVSGSAPVAGVAPAAHYEILREFLSDTRVAPRLALAPASTAVRFHHAYDGGLVDHICEMLGIGLHVATAVGFTETELSHWDLVLASVLHDIHKIGDATGAPNFTPNMLKSGKRSDAIPYESNDRAFRFDEIPKDASITSVIQAYGLVNRNLDILPEGELSLSLVEALSPKLFASLSDGVRFAIRHHDGMYGSARRALMGKETPLQQVLHFADMVSSRRARWMENSPQS